MHLPLRRAALLTVPALGLLLLTGCPGGSTHAASATTPKPAAKPAARAHDGKKLYEMSCAACHGMDAKGLPNLGKDMVSSEFVQGLSDAELVAFIKKGRGTDDPANTTKIAMPPKGGNPALDDAKLQAIVTYIRSLN